MDLYFCLVVLGCNKCDLVCINLGGWVLFFFNVINVLKVGLVIFGVNLMVVFVLLLFIVLKIFGILLIEIILILESGFKFVFLIVWMVLIVILLLCV